MDSTWPPGTAKRFGKAGSWAARLRRRRRRRRLGLVVVLVGGEGLKMRAPTARCLGRSEGGKCERNCALLKERRRASGILGMVAFMVGGRLLVGVDEAILAAGGWEVFEGVGFGGDGCCC